MPGLRCARIRNRRTVKQDPKIDMTAKSQVSKGARPGAPPARGAPSLERRTDAYVSTLRNYIRAMGGELKITAVFPNRVVEIAPFQDVEGRKAVEDARRIAGLSRRPQPPSASAVRQAPSPKSRERPPPTFFLALPCPHP